MRKILVTGILTVLFAVSLCACADSGDVSTGEKTSESESLPENMSKADNIPETFQPFGEELNVIPEAYFDESDRKGTLTELNYETYESKTYEKKEQLLHKRAIVYLPYNYDESRKYNVFYLMHGGWSSEATTLGTPDAPSSFRNVIDNAIAAGEIEPLIIVCPTYNNLSGSDSGDYSLALQLTNNYHNELVNDLIPAVEGAYSTYAGGTSSEELIAAREHRGFGGFSMGSVTTWRTFEYCLDYFRYFMPMSGSLTTDGSYMDNIVKNSGYAPEDFFILAITGTEDFAASAFERQIEDMKKYTDSFRYTENGRDGNLTYRIKEGYSHDGNAAMEYTYNGLRWFWNTGGEAQSKGEEYTADTKISEVIGDSVFEDYGRLIFPANKSYYSGDTLGELGLTWYSHIDSDKTVEIANYMRSRAQAGETVFYDIYTEEEKAADPAKRDTGLFFFKGNPGARFAVCSAGGGFAYVSYGMSAYAAVITVTGFTRIARTVKNGIDNNPFVKKLLAHPFGGRYLTDAVFRTELSLYMGFLINVMYIVIKMASGIYYRSAWFIAISVYYILLALMRFLLFRHVNKKTVGKDIPSEWRRYRLCGIVLLMMNQALAGIVVFIVHQNRGYNYPGLLIYAMAAYTFYITITAVINLVKFRKHKSPILSAAKAVNLVAALVSMLSLTTAMLAQFGGEEDSYFRAVMTGAVGGGVCVIVLGMAVFMIIRSAKQLKIQRENGLSASTAERSL